MITEDEIWMNWYAPHQLYNCPNCGGWVLEHTAEEVVTCAIICSEVDNTYLEKKER